MPTRVRLIIRLAVTITLTLTLNGRDGLINREEFNSAKYASPPQVCCHTSAPPYPYIGIRLSLEPLCFAFALHRV